jgi:predicted protein tyrosine phosphatase
LRSKGRMRDKPETLLCCHRHSPNPKISTLKNILFVCSQNRLRSPTAEQIYSQRPDLEVASAGTNNDAETPLTLELIEWADMIFVMEKTHRTKLQTRFRSALKSKRVVCLDIPDKYEFMDPALVSLLKTKLARFLP